MTPADIPRLQDDVINAARRLLDAWTTADFARENDAAEDLRAALAALDADKKENR